MRQLQLSALNIRLLDKFSLVIIIITSISDLVIDKCDSNLVSEDSSFLMKTVGNDNRQHREKRAADNVVPANYNIHELPPKEKGEVAKMRFSVLIMGVRDIKEISEEISVEMNMYIHWRDARFANFVKNDFAVIQPHLLGSIWHPDIFFENLKKVSQPTVVSQPASLRIYNDSSLRYSARIAVTVACDMLFYYYPSDTQRCNIDLKSYAYNDKQLRLFWHEVDSAKFGKRLILSNFYVGLAEPTTFSFTTQSGTFPGLRFTVILQRKLSYHIIQTYIPSSLLVCVSWLSFLVPPDSVPGRMAICVTCLLTLIAMFASVRQLVPNVAYVKAIDIWMVVCVFFVFIALAEFTIVLKLLSIKKRLKASNELSTAIELKEQPSGTSSSSTAAAAAAKKEDKTGQILFQEVIVYKSVAAGLEKRASIVLPCLFILFNIIYWSWLLSSSSNPNQNLIYE